MPINFNKPYFTGKETDYIKEAVALQKISGDGHFTKKCHTFIQQRYGFKKELLTTSCTDALDMAALLINIKPGDEIIYEHPSGSVGNGDDQFATLAHILFLEGARWARKNPDKKVGERASEPPGASTPVSTA